MGSSQICSLNKYFLLNGIMEVVFLTTQDEVPRRIMSMQVYFKCRPRSIENVVWKYVQRMNREMCKLRPSVLQV